MPATDQLPGVFGTLAPIITSWGYLAVAAFVFLEDFGVPLPGETILITAAVFAGTGKLNVFVLGIVAVAAAVAGDNVGFAIGHFGGRALVLRWGRYVFLTEERLNKVEEFFVHHGGKIVTISRFVEGLRQANGIVAGISKMRWLRFLMFNILGAVLWCGAWIAVGYAAGSRINKLYDQFHQYEIWIGVAVGVLFAAFVAHKAWRHVQRRREASRRADAGDAAPENTGDTRPAAAETHHVAAEDTGGIRPEAAETHPDAGDTPPEG